MEKGRILLIDKTGTPTRGSAAAGSGWKLVQASKTMRQLRPLLPA